MQPLLDTLRTRPLPVAVTVLVALFAILFPLTIDVNALRGWGTRSFFIQPRVAVLYVAVWLALGALLLLINWRWFERLPALLRTSPATVALLFSALAFATAPLFASLTPLNIGYHGPTNRGDGAWMFVIAFIFAATTARLVFLLRPAGWVVVGALTLVSSLVGAMAAYQGTGGDLWAHFGVQGMQVGAGSATMGSPVFITVLSGMTLVMFLTGWVSWRPHQPAQWALWAGGVAIAGWLAFSIIASGGRSAIVGTAVVLLVWLALALLAAGARRHLPLAVRFLEPLILALAIVVGGYLGFDAGGRGASKLQELGMLVSEDRANESNATSRLIFYRTALDGLLAQPLRPYGVNAFVEVAWEAKPANFNALMNHYDYVPEVARETMVRQGASFMYVDPESGQWIRRDTYHDKVHNYILDVWLAFGLVPLLLLVTFLALIFFRLLRARTLLSLGAAGAIAVYAIYAQAWFPAPATDPLLFILLGIGWGDAERALRPPSPEEVAPKMSRAAFRRLQRTRK
jgi:hypothetical protein